MSISNRERFLDICHFKRPGDLYLTEWYWPTTLEEWVKQGAPKQIINPRFLRDYFQFQNVQKLAEIKSGIISPTAWVGGKEVRPKINLGHGIMVTVGTLSPLVPTYEPRIISEDESTVTLINVAGQTVKCLKESLKTGWGMPMYLNWPVKDRATWELRLSSVR